MRPAKSERASLIPSLVRLTCKDVTELITEYMHGTLSAEERLRLEQHMHACTWCMTYLKQMRRTVEWTSQLAAPTSAASRETVLEHFRCFHREQE